MKSFRCKAAPRKLSRLTALVLMSLLWLSTMSSQSGKVQSGIEFAALSKAPQRARALRNPFDGDAVAMTAGRKLFLRHCAECHGKDADGGNKAPSLRVDEIQQATPGTLFWILTNGVVRRGMPVWSKLPEGQRWQLIAYIKSLQATPKITQQ